MIRMTRSYIQIAIIVSVVTAPVFAAAVAGTAAPSSAPAISQTVAAPKVVVKDPENRFTIMVPVDWSFQTSTGARTPAVSARSHAAGSQLPDSVEVITQDLPTAINAQECGDKISQVMRYTIHRWNTLREGTVTFAGMPAYSRAYTWHTSTGLERRSEQMCVTMGRRAFVMIGTTTNDQRGVREELPQLQRIIATFRPNATNLPPSDHPAIPHSKSAGDH